MVDFFGKLPEPPWWSDWKARAEFFEENEKRNTVEGVEEESNTLRDALNYKIETFQRDSKDKKILTVPEYEQELCENVLKRSFSHRLGIV